MWSAGLVRPQRKNRHHWLFATRKLVDPRWEAPLNGKLSLSVETTSPGNTVSIQVRVDSWRGYTKRKATTWSTLSKLSQAGQQTIDLSVSDFRDENGQVLKSWFGITELIIQPGNKAKVKSSANISNWKGSVPKLKGYLGKAVNLFKRLRPTALVTPHSFLPSEWFRPSSYCWRRHIWPGLCEYSQEAGRPFLLLRSLMRLVVVLPLTIMRGSS